MAQQSKVILHGMWASLYVRRVEMALKIKGIPFEYLEEDLSNKSPSLVDYNPVYKKVPVLVHEGKPICESLFIIEYIDETWKDGPKLLPDDPYQRAQVRFWANFFHQQVSDAMFLVFITGGEDQGKAQSELFGKLACAETGMRCFLSDGKGLLLVNSESLGLVDIVMSSLFGPYKALEEAIGMKVLDPDRFPLLYSWVTAMNEIPLVKEATPPLEKMVPLLKLRRERILKSSSASPQ